MSADQAGSCVTTEPKGRRRLVLIASVLTCAVSLLFVNASGGVARSTGGTTIVAPGVIYYGRPAASAVGPRDALRAWPGLASAAAAELPDALVSGVLFAHFYTVGETDFDSAEWVLAAITGRGKDKALALLRFTFRDQRLIATYREKLAGDAPVGQSRAAATLRQTPLWEEAIPGPVASQRIDGFIFFVSEPTDFGGTAVLTRDGGKLAFAATSVYDGRGRLLFPAPQ